eukprot:GILK01009051.1.p1 GENE.GILK01009051.1~~GILK01009051.1.p1  ORF type:complete len:497 (-),score=60.38 GILK01009051.1:80-1465(-)
MEKANTPTLPLSPPKEKRGKGSNRTGGYTSQGMVRKLFKLPHTEDIFEDFSCAISKRMLLHGRMFLTENYICFYSKIFGFETKEVVPLATVLSVHKSGSSIELRLSSEASLVFSAFVDKEEVFKLVETLWKRSRDVEDDSTTTTQEDSTPGSTSADSVSGEAAEVEFLPLDEDENKTSLETEIMRVMLPCTVQSFFETFFADEAVFSWKHFLEQRGDTELDVTLWSDSPEMGFTRQFKFRTPVRGVPIGPSSTRIIKIQRYRMENEWKKLSLEGSSTSLDVPYGDHFSVEERWVVNQTEDNPDKCMLQIFSWCKFNKSTWWKKTIETRVKVEASGALDAWLTHAKTYIQAAPQPEKRHSASEKTLKPLPHALETASRDTDFTEVVEGRDLRRSLKDALFMDKPYGNVVMCAVLCFLLLVLVVAVLHIRSLSHRMATMETQMADMLQLLNGGCMYTPANTVV